jgi:hypothetical protein
MKKSILIIAASLFTTICSHAQSGLKITTAIPTNYGMVQNVQVKFSEFYLNKTLGSQFSVYTQNSDTIPVETFIVNSVYNFQLSSIPTIQTMWDSVANRLRAKGLTVEDL